MQGHRRDAAPERSALQHLPANGVGRDDEAQALESARLRQDMAHDADDIAVHIEHRPTRVALVDRCVGLKQFNIRRRHAEGGRILAAMPRRNVAHR